MQYDLSILALLIELRSKVLFHSFERRHKNGSSAHPIQNFYISMTTAMYIKCMNLEAKSVKFQ